jgi:hypothetical protein
LQDYLGYKENCTMYYKFDDGGHEGILGLINYHDIIIMLNELVKSGRRKLHIYVEHAVDQSQPVEVVPAPLLLPQVPYEVQIDD